MATLSPRKTTIVSNGSNANVSTADFEWGGGPGMLMIEGTFTGLTVKLQVKSTDTSAYFDVSTETTMTAPGVAGFNLPAGALMRVNIAGTSVSGLYVTVRPLPASFGG